MPRHPIPAPDVRRGRYAARLIPHAERIVGAVHDNGPDELLDAITAALTVPAPDDVNPVVALCTVLAAMVNPNTTRTQRLHWVHALDRPARPAPPAAAPVSEHLPLWTQPATPAERDRVIDQLGTRGLHAQQIADQLGIDQRTVTRARARIRATGPGLKEAG